LCPRWQITIVTLGESHGVGPAQRHVNDTLDKVCVVVYNWEWNVPVKYSPAQMITVQLSEL